MWDSSGGFQKKKKKLEVAVKSKEVTPQAYGKDVGKESIRHQSSADLKKEPGFYENKVMNIFVLDILINTEGFGDLYLHWIKERERE